MDGTRPTIGPSLPDNLAQIHLRLSVELERLHQETLAMQSTISPLVTKSVCDATAMASLQNLDAHAQILFDLSSILHELGQSAQNNKLDLSALKELKILPSTAAAILGRRTENQTASKISGEVTFF